MEITRAMSRCIGITFLLRLGVVARLGRLVDNRSARLTLSCRTRIGHLERALCLTLVTHRPILADRETTSVTLTTLTEFVKVASRAWAPPA